jgi:hypothetical protein
VSHLEISNSELYLLFTDVTMSGDGTSLRHLNYESKHANFRTTLYNAPAGSDVERIPEAPAPGIVPGYTNAFQGDRVTRFLGLTSAPDHTSETQLTGWKELNTQFHETYNESPRGQEAPISLRSMPAKLTAANTDHAADQKKLARGIKDWKIESERIVRGEKDALQWTAEDLLELIVEESGKKIDMVGSVADFDALSAKHQEQLNTETYERIFFRVGEMSYVASSPEQQRAANLFVWAGCCMHKELNAVKGGDAAMRSFWIGTEFDPPMKLMNIDNARAAASGSLTALKNAETASQGGGTKLTSLAGAIFKHKDEKKGQADTFRIFFEREIGYMIRFPDTSNTRYQSHCLAAGELLVHLDLYLKLLDQVCMFIKTYYNIG